MSDAIEGTAGSVLADVSAEVSATGLALSADTSFEPSLDASEDG